MSIEVLNESGQELDVRRLSQLARFVMDEMRVHPQAELCIKAVDEDTIAELNEQWMEKEGPTDVLAFPMDELRPGRVNEDPEEGVLGDLVLSPAACYPVYPIAASRGPLPAGGLRFDVAADCFRREPSRHLDRLQSFRMREYVCIGSPDNVADFRERWMERAQAIARNLGLTFRVDHASDPFFGRVGQMKAVSQKQQSLKFELLVPLRSEEQPTACMSFNYHRDHFGTTWGITDANGEPAHTGCVAFGMDRLAVAMFHTHGTDPAKWPAEVRQTLGVAA